MPSVADIAEDHVNEIQFSNADNKDDREGQDSIQNAETVVDSLECLLLEDGAPYNSAETAGDCAEATD